MDWTRGSHGWQAGCTFGTLYTMAQTRKIALHYMQHASWAALPEDDRELLELAAKAARSAYAPYSKFKVGAALRMESGSWSPEQPGERELPSRDLRRTHCLHAAMAVLPKGW